MAKRALITGITGKDGSYLAEFHLVKNFIVHGVLETQHHEIYHFGAQSHGDVGFDLLEYTGNIASLGTTQILEAIRKSKIDFKFF